MVCFLNTFFMIDTQIKAQYQFTEEYIPQDRFTLQHPHNVDILFCLLYLNLLKN